MTIIVLPKISRLIQHLARDLNHMQYKHLLGRYRL